ncbi:MAG: carbon-nitrogen hydrolase family protein [Acholeplasma sp.]|nr:carbon-nitrogen hydrolase family protein [Acholeplasma sp.]
MKILMVQNTVLENPQDTLKHIEEIIVGYKNIDFLVLPEMFTTPYQLSSFKDYSQHTNSLVLPWLKALAERLNCYVIGGSVPESSDGKIYNTTFAFDRNGKIVAKYRKIHLFSVNYPDGSHFYEADVLSRGNDVALFETEFGKMGLMICFDVRFPWLANRLMKRGAKVIFVPAAFNTFTGPLHWQVTFRARAIDNQLFMVGVSPSRESFGDYNTYGHSILVDPFGYVITEMFSEEEVRLIEIDLDEINRARTSIPIVKSGVYIKE